jgi:galacturan 1,4-alpha-galacturonidase
MCRGLKRHRGIVNNIRFENFYIEGAAAAATISQDSGNNGQYIPCPTPCHQSLANGLGFVPVANSESFPPGSFSGTSNMLVTNVAFVNFTGWLSTTSTKNSEVSCSTRNPCYNIDFRSFAVSSGQNGTQANATGTCKYTETGGVHGLAGC